MKLFKSFGVIIAVSISLLALCIPASAQSVSEAEMEQVNQALEEYADFWDNSEIYGKMPEIKKAKSSSNLNNVYKSYIINGFIVDEYENAEDFGSLISDKTKIFAESGNQLVTLIEKDGKLEAIGSMLLEDGEELINFEDEAEKLREQSNEEISDMKFVKSYVLYLDMIYYKTENGEFVVPYFNDVPESFFFGTMESGKAYTADEFVGRLNCIVDLSNFNPDAYGGPPFREVALEYSGNNTVKQSNNSSYTIYIVIASSGLVALGLIIFFSVKIINRKS